MEFYEAGSLAEVVEHLQERPNVTSCIVQDQSRRADARADLAEEGVHYILCDDFEYGGYVMIFDLDSETHGFLDGEQACAIDLAIPREIGTEGYRELAEFLVDRGYDRAYLNAAITWVQDTFPDAEIFRLDIVVPDLRVLKHFEEGSGEYTLIDLLAQES